MLDSKNNIISIIKQNITKDEFDINLYMLFGITLMLLMYYVDFSTLFMGRDLYIITFQVLFYSSLYWK